MDINKTMIVDPKLLAEKIKEVYAKAGKNKYVPGKVARAIALKSLASKSKKSKKSKSKKAKKSRKSSRK